MTNDDRAAPAEKKSWSDNKMALFGLPAENQRLTKMGTVAEAKRGGNRAMQPSPDQRYTALPRKPTPT